MLIDFPQARVVKRVFFIVEKTQGSRTHELRDNFKLARRPYKPATQHNFKII